VGNTEPIWIASLHISESIARKIALKHGLSVHELRAHLVANRHIRGHVNDHPVHGYRVLVRTNLENGRSVEIVLELENPAIDSWSVRTARYSGNSQGNRR